MAAASITAPLAWEDIVPRWTKYAPPARPSADDVARIRSRIRLDEEGDQVEVLVLGSTPELRAMLAGIPRLRVTILDRVLPMMQAMTTLIEAESLNEVWICGDWLTAPLPPRYFDLVVSDLVLGNLNPDDQRGLMSRVRSILKPGGHWVSRMDCVDEYSVFEDLDTLLEHYSRLSDPTPEDVCELRSVAGLRHWDPASGFLSYAALGEAMDRYWDGDRFVHPNHRTSLLLTRLREVTLPYGRPYWLSRKAQLDAALGQHFRVVDEQRDDSPYAYPGRGYYVYDLAPRV
ncbi:class I SAM-dependent methyltransferase [Dactylosporangium sp. CA-139066]|uniref:class I SAM-dependent methyltransferase n=1 Tax=Dactylosporangium sp. CA-139066 TaxID=3239930 RepID=UPI003D8CC497